MVTGEFLTSSAAAYSDVRPGYPAEVLADTELHALGRAGANWLDVAAGTGKLVRTALNLGFTVTAVEPDPHMLDHLRSTYPQVHAIHSSAEDMTQHVTGEFQVVAVGQAAHYMNLKELISFSRRITQGGYLLVASNHPIGGGWLSEVAGQWRHLRQRDPGNPVRAAIVALKGELGHGVEEHAEQVEDYSRDRAIGLVQSLSSYQALSKQDQIKVTDLAAEQFERRAGKRGTISLSFDCEVILWRL